MKATSLRLRYNCYYYYHYIEMTDSSVKDHYLNYPYPRRNPEDEKINVSSTLGLSINELNYWLYEGKKFLTIILGYLLQEVAQGMHQHGSDINF